MKEDSSENAVRKEETEQLSVQMWLSKYIMKSLPEHVVTKIGDEKGF